MPLHASELTGMPRALQVRRGHLTLGLTEIHPQIALGVKANPEEPRATLCISIYMLTSGLRWQIEHRNLSLLG